MNEKREKEKKLKKKEKEPSLRLESFRHIVTTNHGGGEGGNQLCIVFKSVETSAGARKLNVRISVLIYF